MRKLKTGTFVALDKNFKNICVGDNIRDTEGRIYKIDNYGRAIRKEDGVAMTVSDIKEPTLYLPEEAQQQTAPDTPAQASATDNKDKETDKSAKTRKAKAPKATKSRTTQGPSLAEATDQQLADELRRRGYKLTAKKTVTTKL